MTRPNKSPIREAYTATANMIINRDAYIRNNAIDECRAYYESDEYIQELINSGRIGVDEEMLEDIIYESNGIAIGKILSDSLEIDVSTFITQKIIDQSKPILKVNDNIKTKTGGKK